MNPDEEKFLQTIALIAHMLKPLIAALLYLGILYLKLVEQEGEKNE
jgi:hypothetical protein